MFPSFNGMLETKQKDIKNIKDDFLQISTVVFSYLRYQERVCWDAKRS